MATETKRHTPKNYIVVAYCSCGCGNISDVALTAAPETAAERDRLLVVNAELLEGLQALNHYVQSELIPNVRSIEGGQYVLDRGWDLVAKSHTAIAHATEGG